MPENPNPRRIVRAPIKQLRCRQLCRQPCTTNYAAFYHCDRVRQNRARTVRCASGEKGAGTLSSPCLSSARVGLPGASTRRPDPSPRSVHPPDASRTSQRSTEQCCAICACCVRNLNHCRESRKRSRNDTGKVAEISIPGYRCATERLPNSAKLERGPT